MYFEKIRVSRLRFVKNSAYDYAFTNKIHLDGVVYCIKPQF